MQVVVRTHVYVEAGATEEDEKSENCIDPVCDNRALSQAEVPDLTC